MIDPAAPGGGRSPRILTVALACVIAAFVAAIYAPVVDYEFITLDDSVFIYENPFLKEGFTARSLAWALTADLTWNSPNVDYWQPVTLLSRILDARLFGMWAGGHHLVNVAWHAINVVLLFLLLEALLSRAAAGAPDAIGPAAGGGLPRAEILACAAVAAAAWGVHPLGVGTVAWVTDRKSLLATAFSLAALLVHVRRSHRRPREWAAGVLPWFALALCSKPTVAFLPAVFVLLDAWPLGVLRPGRGWQGMAPTAWRLAFTAPLSALFILLAFAAQKESLEVVPFAEGVRHVPVALAWYLRSTFLPGPFACFYPYPLTALTALAPATAWGTVLPPLLAAVFLARRWPALAVGFLWFLVILAPAIRPTHESWATRHAYAALIGWTLPMAVLLRTPAGLVPRRILLAVAVVVVFFLARNASDQLIVWRASEPLYRTAVAITGPNYLMEVNRGILALDERRYEDAMRHYRLALTYRPMHALFFYNMGVLHEAQGRDTEALDFYGKAVAADPRYVRAHYNRGTVALRRKDLTTAERSLERAIELSPRDPEAINNLGVVRLEQGRLEEALELFVRAWPLHFRQSMPAGNAGHVSRLLGRLGDAATWYERAIEADSGNAANRAAYQGIALELATSAIEEGRHGEADARLRSALAYGAAPGVVRYTIGVLRERQGRDEEARGEYAAVLAEDPAHDRARYNLGTLSLRRGDAATAERELALVAERMPDDPEVLNNLGAARLALGRPAEALPLFERAWRHHPRKASPATNAGKACAALGRDREAIRWYRRALDADPGNAAATRSLEELGASR